LSLTEDNNLTSPLDVEIEKPALRNDQVFANMEGKAENKIAQPQYIDDDPSQMGSQSLFGNNMTSPRGEESSQLNIVSYTVSPRYE